MGHEAFAYDWTDDFVSSHVASQTSQDLTTWHTILSFNFYTMTSYLLYVIYSLICFSLRSIKEKLYIVKKNGRRRERKSSDAEQHEIFFFTLSCATRLPYALREFVG